MSEEDEPLAGETVHAPELSLSDGQAEPLEGWLARQGKELGFAALAVTDARPLQLDNERLEQWLSLGYHGELDWMATSTRHDPGSLLPGAQSMIVAAAAAPAVSHPSQLPPAAGRIARYAWGEDYHRVLKRQLRALADRLAVRERRVIRARACVDTAPLLERAAAARSGIAFIGKNTMAIVPGVGSHLLLGVLLVDCPLIMPSEATRADASRCGSCRACLDACPTAALPEPWLLDARRCIAYLTIEHQGSIPAPLRPLVGDRVFGCDVCQDVCPFNGTKRPVTPGVAARSSPPVVDLRQLLELSSPRWRKLVKGTPMKRTSRRQLARNAAVAMGNSSDAALVPALEHALSTDPRQLVREHAAWALGQIGDDRARDTLARCVAEDTSEAVRAECQCALGRLDPRPKAQ